MSRAQERQDQILVALLEAPLDRVRLMKTLFLVWYRAGRDADGPFDFEPYLYGPCAFDLYDALAALEARGLVAQAAHAMERWGKYHLTDAGRAAADEAVGLLRPPIARAIRETARWAAQRGFRSLLDQVYAEAPEYARRSVLRSAAAAR